MIFFYVIIAHDVLRLFITKPQMRSFQITSDGARALEARAKPG